MTAPSTLLVHDDAVRANTRHFAALTAGRLMAVLKADGFGHGPVAASVVQSGASSIGVTSIEEALALRAAGVRVPVLSWLNPVDADLEAAILADVDLAVPGPELLHAAACAARSAGRPARVHLHIDVGMARDGCPPENWRALCNLAGSCECDAYTDVYGAQVYEIEYTDNGSKAYPVACAAQGKTISVIYRDRNVVPRGATGYVYKAC